MPAEPKKKPVAKPVPKKAPAPRTPAPSGDSKPLPLAGKKVHGAKRAPPKPNPEKAPAPVPTGTPIPPEKVAPPPEVPAHEKPLCWIELVKNGTVFVARSSTTNGVAKEYKNRVLEDMLTELMVELQEELQE